MGVEDRRDRPRAASTISEAPSPASPCAPASQPSISAAQIGANLTMIDRNYGHLARHGREHAIRLFGTLSLSAVDVRWTFAYAERRQ